MKLERLDMRAVHDIVFPLSPGCLYIHITGSSRFELRLNLADLTAGRPSRIRVVLYAYGSSLVLHIQRTYSFQVATSKPMVISWQKAIRRSGRISALILCKLLRYALSMLTLYDLEL